MERVDDFQLDVANPVVKSTGLLYSIKLEDDYALHILFHHGAAKATVKDVSPPGPAKIPPFNQVVEARRVHTTIAMLKQWASGGAAGN